MKKIFLFLIVVFLFTGCTSEPSILMIGGSGGGSGNTTYIYNNITNNITQSINTTFNITQNFTTINNFTNNITNNVENNFYNNITNNITFNITNNITQSINTTFNITNNFTATLGKGVVNNDSLNITNQGSIGQVLSLASNGQFSWTTDQTGSGGGGGFDLTDEFSRHFYAREAAFESVTAAFNEPWVGAAIASGTSVLGVGDYNHPGTTNLSSSATASSGYSWSIANAGVYLLGANYTTSASFRLVNKTGNVTQMRYGFMDTFVNAYPVDGLFFNFTQVAGQFNVSGKAMNNSRIYNTTTSILVPANAWYSANIYIVNHTFARFSLWNETGTLLWSDNVTNGIPYLYGRQTSNAVVAYVNGGTTAQKLLELDFLSVAVNQSLRR